MLGIDVAKQYLGKEEKKDRKLLMELFKKASIILDPATTPWCAAFINGCEVVAGKNGNARVNARSFLTYGELVYDRDKKLGKIENAQEGDICIFERGNSTWQGHVTYFIEYNSAVKAVSVLGGNQADKVCESNYLLKGLLGIRRSV